MEKKNKINSDFGSYLDDTCDDVTRENIESRLASGTDSEEMDEKLRELWNARYELPDSEVRSAFSGFKKRVSSGRSGLFRSAIKWTSGIAAILFLPLLIYTFYSGNKEDRMVWMEKYVENGCTEEIVLPDGSVVRLNAGSHILYPEIFGSTSRQVFITGEAYLEVAKDKKRPFVLSAGPLSVEVLGTVFNIKSYTGENSICLNLLEGSVMVTGPGGSPGISEYLSPGETIVYDRSSGKIEKSQFNPANFTPWWEGGISFRNETFEEIMAQLSRIFDVRIIVRNEELKQKRFYMGFMNGETLEEMLEAINFDGEFRIESSGDIIDIR